VLGPVTLRVSTAIYPGVKRLANSQNKKYGINGQKAQRRYLFPNAFGPSFIQDYQDSSRIGNDTTTKENNSGAAVSRPTLEHKCNEQVNQVRGCVFSVGSADGERFKYSNEVTWISVII
jgi:hypothetical protein